VLSLIACGWKLKGLLPPWGGPIAPSLIGVGVSPADGMGELIEPNPLGKDAFVGDNVFESM
jgi:hypothetical protein